MKLARGDKQNKVSFCEQRDLSAWKYGVSAESVRPYTRIKYYMRALAGRAERNKNTVGAYCTQLKSFIGKAAHASSCAQTE